MSAMSLSVAAQLTHGRHIGAEAWFNSVSTDSRSLQGGELFVALKGPNFDGHSYLSQARERGAVAALVSRELDAGLPLVLVPDTLKALGELAADWRYRHPLPLVAVTGSNGKTTVKEMLAAILGQRGPVLATRGNLNNDIGVPLTLLRLDERHAYAVIEMGANHPGEIAYLTGLAQPDVAMITNAGPAHLEGFGSVAGVARAKAEIYAGLGENGVAVINADDDYAGLWRQAAAGRAMLSFGLGAAADLRSDAGAIREQWDADGYRCQFPLITPQGDAEVEIRLLGRHNVLNALAAAAAALAAGADLDQVRHGLALVQPVKGRLQPRAGIDGARLIDDSYNANPASVEAAIRLLSSFPGRRVLVLGDLAELGPQGLELHAELGHAARRAGLDGLLTVGEASRAASEAFGDGASHYPSRERLIQALREQLGPQLTVLVKGSRAAAMEQVVAALMESGEGGHAAVSG